MTTFMADIMSTALLVGDIVNCVVFRFGDINNNS